MINFTDVEDKLDEAQGQIETDLRILGLNFGLIFGPDLTEHKKLKSGFNEHETQQNRCAYIIK